jgi:hypothetical protein
LGFFSIDGILPWQRRTQSVESKVYAGETSAAGWQNSISVLCSFLNPSFFLVF